jgi:hypothetical protein
MPRAKKEPSESIYTCSEKSDRAHTITNNSDHHTYTRLSEFAYVGIRTSHKIAARKKRENNPNPLASEKLLPNATRKAGCF